MFARVEFALYLYVCRRLHFKGGFPQRVVWYCTITMRVAHKGWLAVGRVHPAKLRAPCASFQPTASSLLCHSSDHLRQYYWHIICYLDLNFSSLHFQTYILKQRDLGDRSPPIFFIFRQNLGWERENQQDWTAPMPLHPFVVFALFSIYPLLI